MNVRTFLLATAATVLATASAHASDRVRGDGRTTAAMEVARLTYEDGKWSSGTTLDYPGDRDCYAVELRRGRSYGLTADGSSTWNLAVEFRDGRNRVLKSASHPATDGDATSAFATWTATYSGRHVVCATGTPGRDGAQGTEPLAFGVAGDCPAKADAGCSLRLGYRDLWHDAHGDRDGFNFAAAGGRTYRFKVRSEATDDYNHIAVIDKETGQTLAEGFGDLEWRCGRGRTVLVRFLPGYGSVWASAYNVEVSE